MQFKDMIRKRSLETSACFLYSCLRLGTIYDNMLVCTKSFSSSVLFFFLFLVVTNLYFHEWNFEIISACSAVLIYIGDGQAPKVTFKKPIGSVTVSGHKFVGCPMPCGVQITRLEHINALSRDVEYLASRDATIMGSRNGHAPPSFSGTPWTGKDTEGSKKKFRNALETHTTWKIV